MSDYERVKVVRFKPTEQAFLKLGILTPSDLWDLEDKMPAVFGYEARRALERAGKPFFTVDSGYNDKEHKCNYYIDCVLRRADGEDAGDWGRIRRLYPTELEKYKRLFSEALGFEIECTDDDMKLVEFCFYNGCDAPDYFDETEDPFYKEV